MNNNNKEMENKKLFEEFEKVASEKWEEVIIKDLKGADYNKKLLWNTIEGFEVRPYYRLEDLDKIKHINALPDKFPFVRTNNTKKNEWDVIQEIRNENPAEANKAAVYALEKGADSVSFSIKNNTDIAVLLLNIDLNEKKVNLKSSKSYPATLASFIDQIKYNNIDANSVEGFLNFDCLSYMMLYGDFYQSKEADMQEALHLVKTLNERLPKYRAINVNAKYFHNAGANAVQELAFGLASANEYLAYLTDKGLKIDEVANKIQFTFAVGSSYFMEIAKFRAARLLWANIVKQYNPKKEESCKTYINATTSLWNKTIFDPYVNMLRTTTESMSAAIGGCDSMTINPFDATYKQADEISSRIARNLQIVLKGESHFDKIIDPSAGSYYIETLTDKLAEAAWKLFQTIEEKGGFVEAAKEGFITNEIEKVSEIRAKNIASRKQTILGTNQFPNLSETMLEKVSIKERKRTLKETQIVKPLKQYRGAQVFEEIRLGTEKHISKGNKQPIVFLLTIGNPGMRTARASFSGNFFGCAGYKIINNLGFKTVEEGVNEAISKNSDIVVICSSDEEYADVAPKIATAIKEKNNKAQVVVAGYPKDIVDSLKAQGVDDFIHVKSNILESLKKYHSILGIE